MAKSNFFDLVKGAAAGAGNALSNALGNKKSTAFDDDESASPKTADPYQDKEAISARIEKHLDIDKFRRHLFEREWFRNILFIAGQHWVIFENGRYRPRNLPKWYPRAQTNKVSEKFNDLVSTLMQSDPPIRYIPESGDEKDQAIAEVGENVRAVIYEESGIDDLRAELASWVVATGNGFLLPHYDMDEKYGMGQTIQSEQCVQCGEIYTQEEIEENEGQCPECGGTEFEPAQNEQGEEIGEQYPIGALQAEVLSPFEIRWDLRVRNARDHRWFVRLKRYDLEDAKEKWSEYADQIKPDNGSDELSNYYLDILAHVTGGFGATPGVLGGDLSQNSKAKKVTAYEFYELPSDEFPEGLRAVRLGHSSETVVEAGPLVTEYGAGVKKGQKFLPLVHFGFQIVPGRLYRKTPLDDVIPLQLFRNTVEANLRLTAQRMGNGVWLDPKGSGVDIITGEPGQHIKYNPVSIGGASMAKPERVPADLSNVQPLIFLINKIDDSIERVSGTFFLQGGDTPPGVTAASALAYLGERAQKAMSPLMREWAKGWKRFEEQALEIARANWDDTRLRVIAGNNKRWEVQQFQASDLQGAVKMVIDYQSMFPKSQAVERATIQELIQMGVIQPGDPEQQWEILKKFGETELKGTVDLDVRDAVVEADDFSEHNVEPNVRPFIDNSIIHLLQHTKFAKTDEFKELDPEKQQVWIAHIQAHVQDIIKRRQMFMLAGFDPGAPGMDNVTSGDAATAAQAAAALGAGPGAPGQGPGAPGLPPGAGAGAGPGGPAGPGAANGARGAMKNKPGAGNEIAGTPDIAAGAQMPGAARGIQAPRQPRPIAPEQVQGGGQ